jgi:hypothetical protein
MKRWIFIPIVNWIILGLFFILSPVLIIILAVRKTIKTKNYKIFFPWMLIFMSVRYFGTLVGYWNKIVWGKNVR